MIKLIVKILYEAGWLGKTEKKAIVSMESDMVHSTLSYTVPRKPQIQTERKGVQLLRLLNKIKFKMSFQAETKRTSVRGRTLTVLARALMPLLTAFLF